MCNSLWDSPLQDMGPRESAFWPFPGSAKGPSDGRWNSHVFASSSMVSSVSHRVWGVETRLGMVSEGGFRPCPGSRRVPPCRA